MPKPAIVPNRVSAVLSPADLAEINKALQIIHSKLQFLVGLDPKQRQSLLKAGDKSRVFIRKAYNVGAKLSGYLPAAFDLEEMRKDVELVEALHPITLDVSQLAEKLSDTLAVVNSEGYAAALVVYKAAKDAKGAEGLGEVVDDLAARFARKLGGTDIGEETETAAASGDEPKK